MAKEQPKKVFISYSWDDEAHKQWVHDFATRLRGDGVDVILDHWHAVPGDELPAFMERSVRDCDFVLCICTPRYKEKSNQRDGGVGYEGDIMTAEAFVSRSQRKFIPVLRTGEWRDAAPSWLFGKYYIDLCGTPYSEQNYHDLISALLDEREKPPTVGKGLSPATQAAGGKDFEFVNRDIELGVLNPAKLHATFWQCALINAPTGYGKTHLLKRLMGLIEDGMDLKLKWNVRYVDLCECQDPDNFPVWFTKQVTAKSVTSDLDEEKLKGRVCSHIHETLSVAMNGSGMRHTLLIVDSMDYLPPAFINWFSSLIHDVVVNSYADYELRSAPFSVRIMLAGVDTESFWKNYLDWEADSKENYRLLPPKKLPLSAFDDLAVQDLISRRAGKAEISLSTTVISDISYELQRLSGGHPQVVCEILDELVVKGFLQYKRYLRDNHERLVENYVSRVAKKILHRFPLPQAQKDIKTICVLRLIDLNTLRGLLSENLVSPQVNINLLGLLCENKILNAPNAEKPFYHDDIIRRILYLDIAHGKGRDAAHVQQTHKFARALYLEWIKGSQESHTPHYFFVEWLFHTLQVTDLTEDVIFLEWQQLLDLLQPTSLPLGDLKRVIREKIESDSEVRYLFRERFGERIPQLFEAEKENAHDS